MEKTQHHIQIHQLQSCAYALCGAGQNALFMRELSSCLEIVIPRLEGSSEYWEENWLWYINLSHQYNREIRRNMTCLKSMDHYNSACLGWLQPYLPIGRNVQTLSHELERSNWADWGAALLLATTEKAGRRAWVSHWQNWIDLADRRTEGTGARRNSAERGWALTPRFNSVIWFTC